MNRVPAITALSVVVPVKNEQDNVIPLLREIQTALADDYDLEVIYVDDGSTDDTARMLAQARQHYPALRVLTHSESCGQSAAIATGVSAARNDWVATLDGDGQNDPADIPLLLAAVSERGEQGKLQLVTGWRRQRHDTWVRRVSSLVANRVRAGLLADGTPDTGCGLKVFPRQVFLKLPYFDHMHRFLPALIRRNGGTTVSVEVRHRPRMRGLSNYGISNRLWVGIVDLLGVRWLQKRAIKVRATEVPRS